jgi:hypothetical protein
VRVESPSLVISQGSVTVTVTNFSYSVVDNFDTYLVPCLIMSKAGKPKTPDRKKYQHDWYIANREKLIARAKQWAQTHPEKRNAYSRKYKKENPEKRHMIQFRSRLKTRYNIDPDYYFELLAKQNNVCAICKNPESNSTGKSYMLAVDHEHRTGKVRSLLCKGCNLGIGNMKESPERLIAAAQYLKEWANKDE